MKIFSFRNLFSLAIICLGLGIGNPFSLVFAESNETLQAMATVLSVFVKFFTFISLMIISWGGELMGTEFLTSDAAMEGIRPMWIYIRNITNIGFVLVLMYLAFSNLFSFGNGSWTIKEKLPRVIIAMIAVNFSLVAFRVVIDAVNVGAVAIFSIADTAVMEQGDFEISKVLNAYSKKGTGELCPLETKTEKDYSAANDYKSLNKLMEGKDCYPFYEVMNGLMCTNGETATDCFFHIKSPSQVDTALKKGKPATSNLMLSFGVYFQHLEQLPALAAKLSDFSGVVDSILFSSIMALAYVVAIVAVFVALLIRMIALWFFMIFSPLLMAAGIMGIGGGGGDIMNKLVTYLIMPLKIAAAFALSFVMIAVLIKFEPASSVEILEPGLALKQFAGGNMFGVLWKIVTVVVFWKAAFMALEGTHVDSFVQNIQSKAEGAGQFMAEAATVDRQIFKIPNGAKVSLSSLSKLPDAIVGAVQTKKNEDFMEMKRALNLTNLSETESKLVKTFEGFGRDIKKNKMGDYVDEVKDRTTLDSLALKEELKSGLIMGFRKTTMQKDSVDKFEKALKKANSPILVQKAFQQLATDENMRGGQLNDSYYKNWGGGIKNEDKDTGPENQTKKFYYKEGKLKLDYNETILKDNSNSITEENLGSLLKDSGITPEELQKMEDKDIETLAKQLKIDKDGKKLLGKIKEDEVAGVLNELKEEGKKKDESSTPKKEKEEPKKNE